MLFRFALGCLIAVAVAPSMAADAPNQQFVESLIERGYFDVALDCLSSLEKAGPAAPELKAAVPYYRAVAILGRSAKQPPAQRQKDLDEAERLLTQFLTARPHDRLSPLARVQLARLVVEKSRLAQDALGRQSAEQRSQQLEKTRRALAEAEKTIGQAEQQIKAGASAGAAASGRNGGGTGGLAQVQLLRATLTFELAQSYGFDSTEGKRELTLAGARFSELARAYPGTLVAQMGRLESARCLAGLGERAKALAALKELQSLKENDEPIRRVRNQAYVLAMEVDLEAKSYAAVLYYYQQWSKGQQASDLDSDEGRSIQYLAGKARLESVRLAKGTPQERARELAVARRAVEAAARGTGPYQERAGKLLADPLLDSAPKPSAGTTFAELRQQVQELMERLKAGGEGAENPPSQAERQAIGRQALEACRRALRKAQAAKPEDRAQLRYFLAYLYWEAGDPYSAAVMGEFVSRRSPKTPEARPAARIALAAYIRLLNSAQPGEDRRSWLARLRGVAQWITSQWPDHPESEDAWQAMVQCLIEEGRYSEALASLEKSGKNHPRQAELQLMAGQALWASYLQAGRAVPPASAAEREKMRFAAQQALQEGLKGLERAASGGERLPPVAGYAALILAQLAAEANDPAAAIKALSHPRWGPLTAIAKHYQSSAPGKPEDGGSFDAALAVEVLKVAACAYCGTSEFAKARETFQAIEKVVAGNRGPGGPSVLQTYLSLARQLQQQRLRLKADPVGKPLDAVEKGLGLVLEDAVQQEEGQTFQSLAWVAETLLDLAGPATDKQLSTESEHYGELAAETLQKILTQARADAAFVPSPTVLAAVQRRLVRTLARLRRFGPALELLSELLRERPTAVDLQFEAARLYQAWGDTAPEHYLTAIRGRETKLADGTSAPTIWGWGKLSKRLLDQPTHSPLFHEARYNLALCRYSYAMTLPSADEKRAGLQQAENDILVIERLYPDLGGKVWRPKYDELLKSIRQNLGRRPTGLPPENAR